MDLQSNPIKLTDQLSDYKIGSLKEVEDGNQKITRVIDWENRASDQLILELLTKASSELNVPLVWLSSSDICNNKFSFFRDRSFKSLYVYLLKRFPPSKIKPDSCGRFLQSMGISPTVTDVIERIKSPNKVNWTRVSSNVVRELLECAAEERGKTPFLLTCEDLSNGFNFLSEESQKPLISLLHSSILRGETRDVIKKLLRFAKIKPDANDLLDMVRRGVHIPNRWLDVPANVIGDFLDLYAEHLGVPTSMLQLNDILTPNEFFNGNHLRILYDCYISKIEDDNRQQFSLFLKELGIVASAEDLVRFAQNTTHALPWSRLSPNELKKIILMADQELSVPNGYVNTTMLTRIKYDFLNDRTLEGLYTHFSKLKAENNIDLPLLEFIKKYCGFFDEQEFITKQLSDSNNPRMLNLCKAFNMACFLLQPSFVRKVGDLSFGRAHNIDEFASREKMYIQCRLIKNNVYSLFHGKIDKLPDNLLIISEEFIKSYEKIFNAARISLRLSKNYPYLPKIKNRKQ